LYLSPVTSGNKAIGCVLLVEDITEERIAARSRDEFFSIASHELRTPLTAIRGNTSIIQQYYPDVVKDPGIKDMITSIHESAVRLIDIVNDFLDASSLEQSEMKFNKTAFKCGPLIKKVIHEMAEVTQSKQVTVEFDAPAADQLPELFADPARTTQVIYNLIGNAVKFTEHGMVTVSSELQGKAVKIRVHDTGIGISPEGQQILFHKFQQSADSILSRDNTQGTGLGLYISKLMVERMGGSIQLEQSAPGKGSTFAFTLPVATPAQRAASAGKVTKPAAPSK
jgi:signal transduction histidine kinase